MNVCCEACQKTIHLGPASVGKYAGRRVRCPACGQPVLVPAVEASLDPQPETVDAPDEPSTEDKPVPTPESKPTGFPHLDLGASHSAVSRHRSKPKPDKAKSHSSSPRSSSPQASQSRRLPWWAIGGGVAGVLLLAGLPIFFLLGGRGGQGSSVGRRGATGRGTIEIAFSDDMRRDTSVAVDGRKLEIPESGTLRQAVPVGTRQVTLRRRGYEQIDMALVVRDGEKIEYRPDWKPMSLPSIASSGSGLPVFGGGSSDVSPTQLTFDEWLQDFEAAKQQAVANKRDILVLFDGSDWCGYSMQMADQVFYDARFAEQIAKQYVLVFLDFPRTAGGKAKVQDAARNARVAQQFRVEGFPTIVLMDHEGLPFGRMGYVEGGFDGFDQHLGAMQRIRDQRNGLLAQAEVGTGKSKLESARQALSLVRSLGFESFYVSKFRQWFEASKESDPKNEAGHQEVFFEAWWLASLSEIQEEDQSALAARVREVDAWAEEHDFVDRELASRLYLQSAWLSRTQPELARKYAEKGLSFEPREEKIRGLLGLLKQAAQDLNVIGTGSGFVVTGSGHIVTNQHVAHGPGRLVVHLPGVAEPVEAKVVAEDKQLDLALLFVALPDDAELIPLPLSDQSPARGARVAAFGFPLGEQVGKGLKLTTGVVSATDQQTENGMILLDCRINPGNSGGPLCNPRGEVVGVVTARSLASAEVDSYGMAVPGHAVLQFLQRVLPGYDADQIPRSDVGDGQWDSVDRAVSSSVLMVQRLR